MEPQVNRRYKPRALHAPAYQFGYGVDFGGPQEILSALTSNCQRSASATNCIGGRYGTVVRPE
jgi:hypothetical protein